jgi:hypothetical protein
MHRPGARRRTPALLRGRVRGGVVGCAGELGADLTSVGVLQVFEDGEGLLPGLLGPRQLAGGVMVVAKVGEGVRFTEAGAGFPVQAERAPVAGSGFGEVARGPRAPRRGLELLLSVPPPRAPRR